MNEHDAQFIEWIEDHETWYESESTKWGRILFACRFLALIAAVVSIIVAAAVTPEYFSAVGRWLIIGSATLTAISTEVLSQLRVREMEELREDGNIEVSAILAYARQKFEEFNNQPERITALKDEIRDRIYKLELSQHRRHVAIDGRRAKQVPKGTPA